MTKVTALTAAGAVQLDDLLPMVDVHDTTMAATGTDKKVTVAALLNVTLVAPPTGVSATDTANINAAITAWLAAGRGVLQFQPGAYLTTGGHLVGGGSPGAGVIAGRGWNTEIELANGANAYIFDFGSSGSPQFTPGLVFRDLYLNCNGANQTAASGGIYARGAAFCVFDHAWVSQPWEAGVRFYQDGLGNYGHHNRFTGCLFTDGNLCTGSALGLAIKFEQCDENSVLGCTFQDNGTATYPGTQVYDTSAGLQTLAGCAFVTTRTTAVSMFKSDSSPSRCVLTGCQFDSSTTGNQLEFGGDSCTVTGSQFLNFGGGGSTNAAVHLAGNYGKVVNCGFTASGTHGQAIAEDSGVHGSQYGGNTYSGTYSGNAPVSSIHLTRIDPVDWGADPAGVTDATVIVAAVIATLCAAGGGVMDCSAGTFKMSAPVSITSDKIRIRGAGAQQTIFKMTASFGSSGVGRGIFQYLSGPAVFDGCEITDCGFDTSACTDTFTNGPNAVYQNGSVPMTNFLARRLYFNLNSYGQGILINQAGASGGASYGLTFRDIFALNGAGTISIYNTGVTAGSLFSGVTIDNIYNRCTATSLQDDRICISGNNGGGTNIVECRNISISNIFVDIISGATGAVNGVKLDCGSYGYIHEVSIRNVFYRGLSGITYNNPVLCNLGTNGTMQDILVDGVWAYSSAAVVVKLWRSDAAPHITIRNVHMYNLLDTRAIEVYTANTAAGDETILIENCTLHSGTAVSGNGPVGVLLTSGASGQGASGLVRLHGITLAGTFSTGLSDNLNESMATQATAYSNIKVSECALSAATTPQNMINASLTAGTVTLNGTTAVTVTTAAVDTKSLILLTPQPTTAPVGIPYVSAVTAGTSFAVKSTSASDTAVVLAWVIIESI